MSVDVWWKEGTKEGEAQAAVVHLSCCGDEMKSSTSAWGRDGGWRRAAPYTHEWEGGKGIG
jgi:hypothetical protein